MGGGVPSVRASPAHGLSRTRASTRAPMACQSAWARELAGVGVRIYDQAASGRNTKSAVRRLRASAALARAVQLGDSRSAKRILKPMLKHQIIRLRVFRGSRLLVRIGSQRAPAPVSSVLRNAQHQTVGRFVLSVTDDRQYAGITSRLTGATVVLRGKHLHMIQGSAARAHHPGTATSYTFRGNTYPSGPLRITVIIPPPPHQLCAAKASTTRLNAIGFVARRLLASESSSRAVRQTIRFAEHDARFRRAVAAADPAAIRRAVDLSFFKNHHFHIVRARVMRGHRLPVDVGGPFVLAPASGVIRSASGQVVHRFALSVQDDTGYIKLVHRFTGADVVLHDPRGQFVPGSTLDPGPSSIPASGAVTYAGRHYRAVTFTGTAFPTGRIHVWVLVPSSRLRLRH